MINKWLVYIHENVEPVLSLVPRSKGSGIAQVVETSNAESPTPVYVYRKHSWQRTTKSSEANKGCIQYTSWGVPVALFLTTFARTARFLLRQNQSVQLRLICIYVCPTSAHRGFRYGYRRYKGNTFTLKTALFGWQSMILRSDLTLLNINMSKKSTFVWFVSQKVCIINDYSYLCSTRTRQASQRCSNVRVVFVFMGIWQQEFRS